MSYRDWHVGMKVVCIDGRWDPNQPGENSPVDGGLYTIRTIEADGDGVFIRLVEIINPTNTRDGDEECRFTTKSFRPVRVRKTDIAVFTALLSPSDKDKHLIEVFDFVSMQGDLQ